MHCGNSPRLRPAAAGLLLLVALASAGCIPGVGWLPDSSGFIYTAGEKRTRLVHYDLAQGKGNVLVEDTGAGTLWPAVSPDGKRIAVAKLALPEGQKRTTLQVILYSRAGKEPVRSEVFDWMELKDRAFGPGPPPKPSIELYMLPQLFWAPRGDRILITTANTTAGYTGIYEVERNRLLHAGEGILFTFGGTPIRPDGAGFLVMKSRGWPWWWNREDGKGDCDPGFAFVDWEGKERALKPPPLLGNADALKKEEDNNKMGALLWPTLYQSAWDGNVAQVSWNVDRMRYVTDKGKAVLDGIKPERTKDGLLIKQQLAFPGGKARVRVVVTKEPHPTLPNVARDRVEVIKEGQEKPTVILDKIDAGCVLIPSPKRMLVAIIAGVGEEKGGRGHDLVVVVNDKGEEVARVPLDP
jgi:hypothetical protein